MTVARRVACWPLPPCCPPSRWRGRDCTIPPGRGAHNITGCIAADPQFTRVHTFTVKNGVAELTAPGGINTRMKLEKPNVYATDYDLGRLNLHVVADLAATPPSLTVDDKNLGCKWTAKKE